MSCVGAMRQPGGRMLDMNRPVPRRLLDCHCSVSAVPMASTVKLATSSASGLYNVGSGQTHTWNELAQSVFEAVGQVPQVDYIEMPEGLRERYQYHTQADLGRLSGLDLGYQKYTLREGVFDYVRNYLLPDAHLGDESL